MVGLPVVYRFLIRSFDIHYFSIVWGFQGNVLCRTAAVEGGGGIERIMGNEDHFYTNVAMSPPDFIFFTRVKDEFTTLYLMPGLYYFLKGGRVKNMVLIIPVAK